MEYLKLAGLASAAVPDLDVVAAAPYSTGTTGDYDAALLRTADGPTVIVRQPRFAPAAAEQLAQGRALAALTDGLRSRLPFTVPAMLGQWRSRETQLAVFSFIPGQDCAQVELTHDSLLVAEMGRSIAAIHALPKSFIGEAGLPVFDVAAVRDSVEQLIDRADTTGRLPNALATRWGAALDDPSLWEFSPSVIHGSLERSSFITNGASVVGVLGWSDLRIGDPAQDMRWAQTLDGATERVLFDEYVDARGATVDRQLRQRAVLYAELELARWLLHGVEAQDATVIADAEQLLDGLVTRVRSLESTELRHETLPVLDLAGVQELLAEAGMKARHHEANLPKRTQASDTGSEERPEIDAERGPARDAARYTDDD